MKILSWDAERRNSAPSGQIRCMQAIVDTLSWEWFWVKMRRKSIIHHPSLHPNGKPLKEGIERVTEEPLQSHYNYDSRIWLKSLFSLFQQFYFDWTSPKEGNALVKDGIANIHHENCIKSRLSSLISYFSAEYSRGFCFRHQMIHKPGHRTKLRSYVSVIFNEWCKVLLLIASPNGNLNTW